jgi:hypothetical protein
MTDGDAKFGKSLSNRRVENRGLALLLEDPRFQAPDLPTKRKIIELLPVKGEFGIQTFDAVMTETPMPAITAENLNQHMSSLRLVEMKTTAKRIQDQNLNGFFFGATEREYAMAKALGHQYLFAFVVLNADNVYGRPFFILLTLEEVERRTRAKRVQYQVNFRSDIVPDPNTDAAVYPRVFRAVEDFEPPTVR